MEMLSHVRIRFFQDAFLDDCKITVVCDEYWVSFAQTAPTGEVVAEITICRQNCHGPFGFFMDISEVEKMCMTL